MIFGRFNVLILIGLIVNVGVVNFWVLIFGRVNLLIEIFLRDYGWMMMLGRVKGVMLIVLIEKLMLLI